MCWRPFDQADRPPIVGRFRYVRQSLVRRGADSWFARALLLGFCLTLLFDVSHAGEPRPASALRIAVYDAPPYGAVGADGSLSGVSVDLWRRVAEELQWQYRLIPVSTMDSVLGGLEQGHFDAAIGAITITPEREARVDFSYPAHRSGVAVALAKESGLAPFSPPSAPPPKSSPGRSFCSWRCSSRSAFSSGGSNARRAMRGKRRGTR